MWSGIGINNPGERDSYSISQLCPNSEGFVGGSICMGFFSDTSDSSAFHGRGGIEAASSPTLESHEIISVII